MDQQNYSPNRKGEKDRFDTSKYVKHLNKGRNKTKEINLTNEKVENKSILKNQETEIDILKYKTNNGTHNSVKDSQDYADGAHANGMLPWKQADDTTNHFISSIHQSIFQQPTPVSIFEIKSKHERDFERKKKRFFLLMNRREVLNEPENKRSNRNTWMPNDELAKELFEGINKREKNNRKHVFIGKTSKQLSEIQNATRDTRDFKMMKSDSSKMYVQKNNTITTKCHKYNEGWIDSEKKIKPLDSKIEKNKNFALKDISSHLKHCKQTMENLHSGNIWCLRLFHKCEKLLPRNNNNLVKNMGEMRNKNVKDIIKHLSVSKVINKTSEKENSERRIGKLEKLEYKRISNDKANDGSDKSVKSYGENICLKLTKTDKKLNKACYESKKEKLKSNKELFVKNEKKLPKNKSRRFKNQLQKRVVRSAMLKHSSSTATSRSPYTLIHWVTFTSSHHHHPYKYHLKSNFSGKPSNFFPIKIIEPHLQTGGALKRYAGNSRKNPSTPFIFQTHLYKKQNTFRGFHRKKSAFSNSKNERENKVKKSVILEKDEGFRKIQSYNVDTKSHNNKTKYDSLISTNKKVESKKSDNRNKINSNNKENRKDVKMADNNSRMVSRAFYATFNDGESYDSEERDDKKTKYERNGSLSKDNKNKNIMQFQTNNMENNDRKHILSEVGQFNRDNYANNEEDGEKKDIDEDDETGNHDDDDDDDDYDDEPILFYSANLSDSLLFNNIFSNKNLSKSYDVKSMNASEKVDFFDESKKKHTNMFNKTNERTNINRVELAGNKTSGLSSKNSTAKSYNTILANNYATTIIINSTLKSPIVIKSFFGDNKNLKFNGNHTIKMKTEKKENETFSIDINNNFYDSDEIKRLKDKANNYYYYFYKQTKNKTNTNNSIIHRKENKNNYSTIDKDKMKSSNNFEIVRIKSLEASQKSNKNNQTKKHITKFVFSTKPEPYFNKLEKNNDKSGEILAEKVEKLGSVDKEERKEWVGEKKVDEDFVDHELHGEVDWRETLQIYPDSTDAMQSPGFMDTFSI